jgi:hypothetical protein
VLVSQEVLPLGSCNQAGVIMEKCAFTAIDQRPGAGPVMRAMPPLLHADGWSCAGEIAVRLREPTTSSRFTLFFAAIAPAFCFAPALVGAIHLRLAPPWSAARTLASPIEQSKLLESKTTS